MSPARTHAGHSIPAAALELGVPEGTIRRAVKAGDIETIRFGGLARIPHREMERLRAAFGRPTAKEIRDQVLEISDAQDRRMIATIKAAQQCGLSIIGFDVEPNGTVAMLIDPGRPPDESAT